MGSGRGGALETGRRIVFTVFFMFSMLVSLLISSGPLLVSVADVVALLVSTSLGCSSKFFSASDWKAYSFTSSLIDIPLLSLVRSLIVICAYSLCSSPSSYKPYFGVTIACALVSGVFCSVKAAVFNFEAAISAVEQQHRLPPWALPPLLLASMAFGFAHIFMAHRARYLANRKLLFRWEDEEARLGEKELKAFSPRKITKICKLLEGKRHRRREFDIPAKSLADADSLFMDCNGILVHYKLADASAMMNKNDGGTLSSSSSFSPPSSAAASAWRTETHFGYSVEQVLSGCDGIPGSNGVVLIHGFGGGVFSWRHVMSPLACQTKSTVVAFDRPGWGLTSRPSRKEWQQKSLPNPYELQSQVDLLFSFCERLHLTSVVLVGHDDGGLLALMAAASYCKSIAPYKVAVKGVVLVGVSLSREVVPSYARILLQTPLGRPVLRPLLRSGIGQVTNRHAWHDASKLTAEILELYKAPLRVQGWDQALAEVSKSSATNKLQSRSATDLLQALQNLPALLVAGLQDMLVPLKAAQSLATKLPQSKFIGIPDCGHLPPEECPGALLAAMLPFILNLFNDSDLL